MSLTPPEKNVERRLAGRIRAKVRRDPCAHCMHRIEGWGKTTCSLVGRRFPGCLTDGRHLQFTLDPDTVTQ